MSEYSGHQLQCLASWNHYNPPRSAVPTGLSRYEPGTCRYLFQKSNSSYQHTADITFPLYSNSTSKEQTINTTIAFSYFLFTKGKFLNLRWDYLTDVHHSRLSTCSRILRQPKWLKVTGNFYVSDDISSHIGPRGEMSLNRT